MVRYKQVQELSLAQWLSVLLTATNGFFDCKSRVALHHLGIYSLVLFSSLRIVALHLLLLLRQRIPGPDLGSMHLKVRKDISGTVGWVLNKTNQGINSLFLERVIIGNHALASFLHKLNDLCV